MAFIGMVEHSKKSYFVLEFRTKLFYFFSCSSMKRLLDIVLILVSLPIMLPVALIVAIAIKLDSPGPVLYWSERIGRNGRPFIMPKFRSMSVGAPIVEAEKFTNAGSYITKVGEFIRKTSLDEIPQFWSVLKGDMSLIGPRPLLPIETHVLELRKAAGVDKLLPEISGWAQINGRTCISGDDKAALDIEYMKRRSLLFDVKIIVLTIWKVVKQDDIVH